MYVIIIYLVGIVLAKKESHSHPKE